MNWKPGCGGRRLRPGWPGGRGPYCCWRTGIMSRKRRRGSTCRGGIFTNGSRGSATGAWRACRRGNVPAARRSFPPEVAMHTVKLACERPDDVGRSLSHRDCAELARQRIADHVVESISPQTVQRTLASHQLKPWRKHLWLSSKVPRRSVLPRTVATHQLTENAESSRSRRFRFDASPATTCDASPAARALSVSRETNRGAEGTFRVAFAPRNLGPKLSDSRVNTLLGGLELTLAEPSNFCLQRPLR